VIYLKSSLCGFAAVIVVILATAIAIITMLAIKSRNLPAGEAYGWDPVSLFRSSPLFWIVLVLTFLIGFAWQYRHAVTRP
jgi:hypothetical protein